MRLEVDDIRCGGFRIVFGETDAEPRVRLLPGERVLQPSVTGAVLQGLADAPKLFSAGLHTLAPQRPYDRVEVSLVSGDEVQGEAMGLGLGCIRLSLGEGCGSGEVSQIARHEALHLLLAAGLPGGEKWDDPELAFGDWIVRGLEALRDPRPPRLGRGASILDKLPRSRLEVQRRIAEQPADFGEPLAAELAGSNAQHQLWAAEAALGAHYLECAARVAADAGEPFLPIALDDWLSDYEQYARGLGNAPSGAGKLWRLSEPGFSRDPMVRLAAAAQALQAFDGCLFVGDRHDRGDEPVLWKSRGRVRVPLLRGEPRARPAPLHAYRAAVRGLPEALALVEDAARGAEGFEARTLWPRMLTRFAAAGLPWPLGEPESPPLVQIVEGKNAAAANAAFVEFEGAATALRALLDDGSVWVPEIRRPRSLATALEGSSAAALLVHGGPLTAPDLLEVRKLAASRPVRGALFADLCGGAAYEELSDLPPPLDPRFRVEAWRPDDSTPTETLVQSIDRVTQKGRLTTPLSFLLSLMAPGVAERHSPS
jgi:hypothetical protein